MHACHTLTELEIKRLLNQLYARMITKLVTRKVTKWFLNQSPQSCLPEQLLYWVLNGF